MGFRGGGVGAVFLAGSGGASQPPPDKMSDSLRGGATGVPSLTDDRRDGAEDGVLLPPGEGLVGVVVPPGVGGSGPKRGSQASRVLRRSWTVFKFRISIFQFLF